MPRIPRSYMLAAVGGCAFAFIVVGLTSMAQSPTNIRDHVVVDYGPAPRDMVQVRQGTPYTVPSGRLFVLTALGTAVNGQALIVGLLVNGQAELEAHSDAANSPPATTMVSVPTGFTISAGSTVEPTCALASDARAWGYLVSQ